MPPSAAPYERVVLVYNPHSSGGAVERARDLAGELGQRAPHLVVSLVPTEYAGHAKVIAADAARRGGALVVSVSGDGGYHEVVAGAMEAGGGRRTAVPVAVAAAGNANDHRRATRRRPLGEAIAAGVVDHLDLLRVCIGHAPPRFAHSYLGVGITPAVALELEKGRKGSVREIVTTVREFARFRPFEIALESGERRRFDSLVLANVDGMAKYARLSDGDPADGRFEVITIAHRGRAALLRTALRAATCGLGAQPHARRYAFRTTTPVPLQLDGEVVHVDGGRSVVVEIAPEALATVR